jgi:hypothetical protein
MVPAVSRPGTLPLIAGPPVKITTVPVRLGVLFYQALDFLHTLD